MKILVVDDEKNVRDSICKYLQIEGMDAVGAEDGVTAQRLLSEQAFSAAVVDLRMPGMDGHLLLKWIREAGLRLPVIMISAHGEIEDAVQAMKSGASDYIVKPFDPEELTLRIRKAVGDQNLRNQVESGIRMGSREFISRDKAMAKLQTLIAKIAPTPSTVLITGESGSGKEVAARLLHAQSTFSQGPFVAVNIGGLPESLLESELFGFEKGAFTGADAMKPGMFELAASGTLFLDEIGEMPLHLQVKLLRVIQERKIMRLGGTREIPVNTRIMAATNKNLEQLTAQGQFREDLFYRINVIHLEIPPLRERETDIIPLTGFFIHKMNAKMGKSITGISPGALKRLQAYDFPGNIRELENILERAFILSNGPLLEEQDISIGGAVAPTPSVPLPGTLKEMEKTAIRDALKRCQGNRTKAAQQLGITRRTVITKIKEYGIQL